MKRRKLMVVMMTLLLLTTITIISGCNTSNEDVNLKNVERDIEEDSITIIKSLSAFESGEHLNVVKEGNSFYIYPDGMEDMKQEIPITADFYEKQEFYMPDIEKEIRLTRKQKRIFEKSKDAVLAYLKVSEKISEDDKPACEEAIKNAKLIICELPEKYEEVSMFMAENNDIYLNKKYVEFCQERVLIHELVHILSDVTNKGSKYEFSAYRSGRLNEMITDIISTEIMEAYGIEDELGTPYVDTMYDAYCMIYIGNMLELYYYSDGFDKLLINLGNDRFDAYMLLLNTDKYDILPEFKAFILTCMEAEWLFTEKPELNTV